VVAFGSRTLIAGSLSSCIAGPAILKALTIIRPETLVRWHRAGFRCYWRWKSLPRGGRPRIETELRVLIRRMSVENPLWRAPRIHGELLKLGFEVAQSSVAKYMIKRRVPPSQGWRTFLRNHAPAPWTCLLSQRLASNCSMPSSSFVILHSHSKTFHEPR
jgi:hypothetical protein